MPNNTSRLFVRLLVLSSALALGACAQTNSGGGQVPMADLPEAVVAMAAPEQNLSSVRVLPEDGCYWYVHTNPVETTLLPLRNTEGRPICTR
jgi:hypothetical protein